MEINAFLNEHLFKLADGLDQKNKIITANLVDDVIKNQSLLKVAQYVGAIGYVLRQNRAMGNCIRRKRVKAQGSMQEVVFECLKEYQDGNKFYDTDWARKYAEVVRQEPEQFKIAHIEFLQALSETNDINTHVNRLQALSQRLRDDDITDDLIDKVLLHVAQLETMIEGDMRKEGRNSTSPFKEAQGFWSGLAQGVSEGLGNLQRGRQTGKVKPYIQQMITALQNIRSYAQQSKNINKRIQNIGSQITDRRPAMVNLRNKLTNFNVLTSFRNQQIINDVKNAVMTLYSSGSLSNNMGQVRDQVEPLLNQVSQLQSGISQGIRTIQSQLNMVRNEPALRNQASPHLMNTYQNVMSSLQKMYQNPFDEPTIVKLDQDINAFEMTLNQAKQDPSGLAQQEVPELSQTETQTGGQAEGAAQPAGSSPATISPDMDQKLDHAVTKFDPRARQYLIELLENISLSGDPKGIVEALKNKMNAAQQPTGTQPAQNVPQKTSPMEMMSSNGISELMKMADVLDTIDTSLGDVADQHIRKILHEACKKREMAKI